MTPERLEFLITETDRHLVGIQATNSLLREVRDELHQIKIQNFANQELHNLHKKIDLLLNPDADSYKEAYSKLIDVIGDWPRAINPDLICQEDSEPDKEYRAESIIEFTITDYLKDKNFLDFGCGEGHVVAAAAAAGANVAMGYDLQEQGWDRFEQSDKLLFFEASHGMFLQIMAHAPYDVILLFDVLDHLENDEPTGILKQLSSVLAPEGKIYVHCHPWCSRHGTHLYQNGLNKAFIHLVLDDIELVRFGGHSNKKTLQITHPVETYQNWFKEAELKISSEQIIEENIEEFFFNHQEIWNRICLKWNDDPTKHLKINSVDYVLTSNTTQVF